MSVVRARRDCDQVLTGRDCILVSVQICTQGPQQQRRSLPPGRNRRRLPSRRSRAGYFHITSLAFWGVHVAARRRASIAVRVLLVRRRAWRSGAYFVRMFVVTAAYHRYFSHRSYKTSRWFQFVLALGAQTAAQKGVLWWASHHRWHHKYSDRRADVHSPRPARVLVLAHRLDPPPATGNETDATRVPDLTQVIPSCAFLNRRRWRCCPPSRSRWLPLHRRRARAGLGLLRLDRAALARLVLDQLARARVRAAGATTTGDDSRNNWLLALLTTGEGWHNNHHHYQSSARQGFRWWEIDMTYYVLRLLALAGLIWDLRRPAAPRRRRARPRQAGDEISRARRLTGRSLSE